LEAKVTFDATKTELETAVKTAQEEATTIRTEVCILFSTLISYVA
jgi:chromosome segregation ATPase